MSLEQNNINMKQIKIIFAILILIGTTWQTTEAQIRRDNIVLEKRDITAFNELDVAGAFTIHLIESQEPFLEIEADRNVLERITTEVRNGRLYITLKSGIKAVRAITVHLGVQELNEIKLAGAVNLKSDVPLRTEELEMKISGAVRTEFELIANTVDVKVAGAASVFLSGKVDNAKFVLEGAGKLVAPDMLAQSMKLKVSGAGRARVHVLDELNVRVSGAALVKYQGNPEVDKDVSGAASVRQVRGS